MQRPPIEMHSDKLVGIAASPGSFAGRALVARQPEEVLGQIYDVLVIKVSSMKWLEAIVGAKAVVTEVGGRTSHAAGFCREFGIPCVTAVAGATSIIITGSHVAVDGSAGTVKLLS